MSIKPGNGTIVRKVLYQLKHCDEIYPNELDEILGITKESIRDEISRLKNGTYLCKFLEHNKETGAYKLNSIRHLSLDDIHELCCLSFGKYTGGKYAV